MLLIDSGPVVAFGHFEPSAAGRVNELTESVDQTTKCPRFSANMIVASVPELKNDIAVGVPIASIDALFIFNEVTSDFRRSASRPRRIT